MYVEVVGIAADRVVNVIRMAHVDAGSVAGIDRRQGIDPTHSRISEVVVDSGDIANPMPARLCDISIHSLPNLWMTA